MTLTTIEPGRRTVFLAPFTPFAQTLGGRPLLPIGGGRSGGINFLVDDRDDDSDPFARDDGGEDEDDEDDDPQDDEEDEDDRPRRGGRERGRGRERERDDDEEWTPPDRATVERMEAALARNNAENRRRRHVGKAMQQLGIQDVDEFNSKLLEWGIDPSTGQRLNGGTGSQGRRGSDNDPDGDPDNDSDSGRRGDHPDVVSAVKRAELRASSRAEQRFRPAVSAFAAEAALREAGFVRGKNIARALRLIDTDSVEIEFDSNGEPILYGLSEQVDDLKREFPEWFEEAERPSGRRRPTTTARRSSGARDVDGGSGGRTPTRPKGWLQALNQQIEAGG